MPTSQEVEHLKSNWLGDPCWDLEDTEGFETHRDELKAFRMAKENEWAQQHNERLLAKSGLLGCHGNMQLAAYVMQLEERIAALEGRRSS